MPDSPTKLPASGPAIVETAPERRTGIFGGIVGAQVRERERIIGAITKVKGLMPLMMKPRNGSRWTREERIELLGQLRALVHLSPYLAVLALPGSVLVLPLLAWFLDRRRAPRRNNPPPGNP